jgi:hypothetical protein
LDLWYRGWVCDSTTNHLFLVYDVVCIMGIAIW